jgi:tetratricopeptide (TPR) repeat protein
MLAFIHMDLGHLHNAERLHREALSLSLEIDYRGSLGWQKAALARTLLCQGKLEEAFQRAGESLATVQEQGDHRNEEATARLTICSVQIYAGHYEQAHQQLVMVSSFVENEGANSQHAWIHHLRGLLALTESSYIEAQSAFATSIRIWHSTYPHHIVPPLAALGLATFRLDQLSQVCQHLTAALANALTYKSVTQALATLPAIALLLATNGNAAGAVEIWALAKCHSLVANSKWFEDVAGRELDELAASLPVEVAEAARKRGRALDLWQTAAALLAELEVTNDAKSRSRFHFNCNDSLIQ